MFKHIIHTLGVATLLMAIPMTVAAQARKLSFDIDKFDKIGVNAFDYRLQKPLPSDTFPTEEQGISKHFFISANVGVSTIGSSFSGIPRPGANVGGQLGTWFTPVHGVRMTGNVGRLSAHRGSSRVWFGILRAEYLMNMSALLRGYDYNRKFELIGAVGLEYQHIRKRGYWVQTDNGREAVARSWGSGYGIEASLQMRFNVAPALYLYAEPRLSVMTGMRYDGASDWRRIRTIASLDLGLGYRILQGHMRQQNSIPFSAENENHLYFGVGGGVWDFIRTFHDFNNTYGSAFVGKMFSPTSGIQLDLSFNQVRSNDIVSRTAHLGIATLNYVLNLGNACGGYSPNDIFQTQINVGVSGAMVTDVGEKSISPGLSIGLTGLFRLSENWGIFVHPQVCFLKNINIKKSTFRNAPLTGVDLGVRYTLGDFRRLKPESYEEYNKDSHHWFISSGVGFGGILTGNYGYGYDAYVGIGKRFTPISSWRAQFVGNAHSHLPHLYTGTIHLDYLSSISTAMYGYDSERLFDLQLVVGVNAGALQYQGGLKATYGLEAGLQGNFRLNKYIDLYVEPQLLYNNIRTELGVRRWSSELRGQIGVRYKLGTAYGERGTLSEMMQGDGCNFISVEGGPLMFIGAKGNKQYVTGGLDVSYGRWLSMVSGVRLKYESDWLNVNGNKMYVGSAHINYLLNLTSLLDRSSSRRIHVIGAIGCGLGFNPKKELNKTGFMAYGGVQARYNLPSNIDVHIEPGITAWANRLTPGVSSSLSFKLGPRIVAGASYRF